MLKTLGIIFNAHMRDSAQQMRKTESFRHLSESFCNRNENHKLIINFFAWNLFLNKTFDFEMNFFCYRQHRFYSASLLNFHGNSLFVDDLSFHPLLWVRKLQQIKKCKFVEFWSVLAAPQQHLGILDPTGRGNLLDSSQGSVYKWRHLKLTCLTPLPPLFALVCSLIHWKWQFSSVRHWPVQWPVLQWPWPVQRFVDWPFTDRSVRLMNATNFQTPAPLSLLPFPPMAWHQLRTVPKQASN